MKSLPKTCGECDRFTRTFAGTFCKPLKNKYGWEPVSKNQSPSVNCMYKFIDTQRPKPNRSLCHNSSSGYDRETDIMMEEVFEDIF